MKKIMNVAAAMMVTTVSFSALAQETPAQPSAATSTTGAAVTEDAAARPAGVPAPGAAASSSTSLEVAKKAAEGRRYKMELYNRTDFAKQSFNNREGVGTTQNYVGASMKFGEGQSGGVRQLFVADYPKNDQPTDYHVGNTYLHFTDSKLAPSWMASRGLGLTSTTRLYLPTGETERFVTKQAGKIRQYGIVSRSFGKMDVSAVWLGELYANTQKTYMKKDRNKEEAGKETGNSIAYSNQYLEVGYNVTSKFTIAQDIGTENTWAYATSAGDTPMVNSLNLTTIFAYQVLPQLLLTANLSHDHTVSAPEREFTPYRDDETTAIFEIVATL